MRNNISSSCLLEVLDGWYPAEMLMDSIDADQGNTRNDADEGKARKDELSEPRRYGEKCLTDSSHGKKHRSMECKLPRDLVERILAMIPFPCLYKVRTLSKTWYNKFPLPCGTSGQPVTRKFHLEQKGSRDLCGCSSRSFQNLVSTVSSRWSFYCPVIIGDEGLIGYDSVHKKWQRIVVDLRPLLSTTSERWPISSYGPLICGVSQSTDSNQYDVLVTNVITRRWRKLPSQPNRQIPSLMNLISDDSVTYKVFLVTEDPYVGPHDDLSLPVYNRQARRVLWSQVFDSRNDSWTISRFEVPAATSFAWRSCSVYLKGNFYCLAGDDRCSIEHPLQLWVYNLEQSSWTEINHPFGQLVNLFTGRSVVFDLSRFQLVVCGSKILIVLAIDSGEPSDDLVGTNTLFVFELDPDTHCIKEKSRGPPMPVLANSEHMASDGTNIFFCTVDLLICYPAVVYNAKFGEWSCLAPDFRTAGPLTNKQWADFAFQPGLGPFMEP